MARRPYLGVHDLSAENQDLDRPNNNLYRVLANSPNCCRVAQAAAVGLSARRLRPAL